MIEKNILSSRFIQAYERLLADNKTKDKKDFAIKIGISASLVTEIAKGRSAVGATAVQNIVLAFGINPVWLLTGKGDMLSTSSAAPEDYRPRIPMTAAAGSLGGFTECITADDCEMIPVIKALPPYDCSMLIKGDSMEPKYEGGDEIALRKVYNIIEWGKTYVLDTRDGAVIKRLYDNGESFKCVSYNPAYPPFEVNKADVFAVYKVIGLIRIQN